MKINVVTQVRASQFNPENDEQQLSQTSPMISQATNGISTTPRTKRRLYSTENNTNADIINVENQLMLARQRISATRAEILPEEAERQKKLSRERSAARRAALTPEQAEQQRALARERSASRRASLTPGEIEKQRALTRERNATTRATLTSEQAEQQRALTRERNATTRATLTPEQAEQQRTLARERSATTRATLTPEQVEQHRALASARTMAARVTASPIIAEEQRVLARKRIAARRAAYTPEEDEKQLEAARKRSRLQKTLKSRKGVPSTGGLKNIEVEWPKPVDMECKINCMKKFIGQMSMSSLAEGVCGLCNIRCYQRDLRRVPLNKIPSVELLKIPEDLCSVLPRIQRTENLHLNESYGINNDRDLTMVGEEAG